MMPMRANIVGPPDVMTRQNRVKLGTAGLFKGCLPGDLRILAMNSQYLGAALLAIAVGIAVGFSSIKAGDEYCPSPSPASVTSLFAPCQTFVASVGHPVSKQEAVQMGLLTPDLQPAPATQLAHNLRSAPLPQPQSETGTGTVGLAKPGPKEIELSR